MTTIKTQPNTIPASLSTYTNGLKNGNDLVHMVKIVSTSANANWQTHVVTNSETIFNSTFTVMTTVKTNGDDAGRLTYTVVKPDAKNPEDRKIEKHFEKLEIIALPVKKQGQKALIYSGKSLISGVDTIYYNFDCISYAEAIKNGTQHEFVYTAKIKAIGAVLFGRTTGLPTKTKNGDDSKAFWDFMRNLGINSMEYRLITAEDFNKRNNQHASDETHTDRYIKSRIKLAQDHFKLVKPLIDKMLPYLPSTAVIVDVEEEEEENGSDDRIKLKCEIPDCAVNTSHWSCLESEKADLEKDTAHDGRRKDKASDKTHKLITA